MVNGNKNYYKKVSHKKMYKKVSHKKIVYIFFIVMINGNKKYYKIIFWY